MNKREQEICIGFRSACHTPPMANIQGGGRGGGGFETNFWRGLFSEFRSMLHSPLIGLCLPGPQ